MPYVEICGARVFYRSYPSRVSERTPVILIHGSASDGATDWAEIAPVLADDIPVYVPDCRGHGSSTNPDRSYSFRQMANDVAHLIREVGYRRAHIVGHSNGGNVALVTLIEHPDVVDRAVLQAANAYVTPYLVEREAGVFSPEAIEAADPAAARRLAELHDPTGGVGYWRELLSMTHRETISNPRYSAGDLAAVRRPTMVVMGGDDPANAPDRHGQFLAEHIPGAEAWIPEGVGHTVHSERRDEWLRRVCGFLLAGEVGSQR